MMKSRYQEELETLALTDLARGAIPLLRTDNKECCASCPATDFRFNQIAILSLNLKI